MSKSVNIILGHSVYKALQDSHANIVTVTIRIAHAAAMQYYQREDRKYKI
jgi:hypothetical protein